MSPPSTDFSYGIIDTVVVSGNEKTKEYVILDEMVLRPGVEATQQGIEFDRNRVYRLGLFNRVDIRCETLDDRLVLSVDVSERWYIIPLPVFGFAEGDVKKPFYGGGVLHNNFQGKNQKLFGLVTFGYNPSLTLSFQNPQISREHNLTFSSSLSYSKIRNKSEIESSVSGDFDEKHYNINATLGKRINLYEHLGVSLGYQIVEIDEYREGRTVSTDGRDAFLLSSLSYTLDSRDLREYPSKGFFLYLAVTKYGFGEADVNFARFNLDTRVYVSPVNRFVLAVRTHGTMVSGGEVPTYARAYFGYGERIRGYYTTVLEGENLTGVSAEIRYDLLTPRIIHFTAIDLPEEFSVWRFGINLAIFCDTGVTWFRGEPVTLTDFSSGYGGGVNFLLPYDIVIRTEYAWNEIQVGQFILGLEASF
jgi:outer membrane protein assembly factor BamA